MNLPEGYSIERYTNLDHDRIMSITGQWQSFAESCLRTWNVPGSHAEVISLDYLCDFVSPSLFDGRVMNPIRKATCDDPRFQLRMARRMPDLGFADEVIEVRLSEFESRYPEISAFIVAAAGRLAKVTD